jgi:ubiquinone/menaquinone biosynthesis C-methylase UbiE
MDKNYKDKWNNYKIGDIKWINSRRDMLYRKKFVEYIKNSNISTILEIGPGEFVEGRVIIETFPNIEYSIIDISKTFLQYCKTVDKLKCYEGDMLNTPFVDKRFDLVYASSVLEHSPDIRQTMTELSRISKYFYFNMFKWKYKEGDLISTYTDKKKYFSTSFNIEMLIDLIGSMSIIDKIFVCNDLEIYDWDVYIKNNNYTGNHRNNGYLSIVGQWK